MYLQVLLVLKKDFLVFMNHILENSVDFQQMFVGNLHIFSNNNLLYTLIIFHVIY